MIDLLREALMNRISAIAAYTAVSGLVALLIYPELRLELQLAFFIYLTVAALVGSRLPGVAPALSLLYIATYLYTAYSSENVNYVLPYAEVAVFALLLVLLVPIYLSLSKIRKLSDVLTLSYHLVVYALAIAWIESLQVSMALFTGLSTLASNPVAIISLTSYSVLLLLTTYVSQYSATSLQNLRAIPREFLNVDRETIGYWVVLRLCAVVLAYLLGLLLVRLIDSRFPISTRGALKGYLLELVRRVAIAIPLSSVVAYTFSPQLPSIAVVSIYTLVFIGTLSLAKSFQEDATFVYSYMLESREVADAVGYKAEVLEEAMKYFQEDDLSSLKGAGGVIGESKSAVDEYARLLSSVVVHPQRGLRVCKKLARLNAELDRTLESLFDELRALVDFSHGISQIATRRTLATIYEEIEVAYSKTEKWKAFHSLIPKISEALRRYCGELQEILMNTLPGAYYELFGFRPVLRPVGSCTDLGARAIRIYQNYILELLAGLDRQIDITIEALSELADEADKLSKLICSYEIKNPYVNELLKTYQSHFSYAHALIASDPLSKLSWAVDTKRTALPKVSELLGRITSMKLGIEELDRALSSSLEPVRRALDYISDLDTPLVETLPILSMVLKTVFNTVGPLSEVGVVIASLNLLERVRPLLEEYISEGIRQGYRFEDVFPLKENLRWLWTLLYGSGDEGAV
ncbi:MAG: hypothetical protein QW543_02125 [Sulfolobales archaeon]